ncbi:hypothetical protein VRK_09250 [Vibrio sp. MEBiC08052]|nr:hypothetical protein VRK_09250 [Vibrio sp. MEBiC08052]
MDYKLLRAMELLNDDKKWPHLWMSHSNDLIDKERLPLLSFKKN